MFDVGKICLQCGKIFFVRDIYVERGQGKFCSISCATRYRNFNSNPVCRLEVREKISKNHADYSGKNNPMYGRRGKLAPSYIDGRTDFIGMTYRRKMLASKREYRCEICGNTNKLHVHHKDKDRKNNELNNLIFLCVKCHNNIAHEHIRDNKGRFIN